MDLNEYIEVNSSSEPEYLQLITRKTYQRLLNPRMISGHFQGRLLSMFSKMIRPKRILELGTFSGYSALCLAEGLQQGGVLDTIEHNDELETLIRENISISPFAEQINLIIGDAITILKEKQEQESPLYDLIFIDADKREYLQYYELCLPLLSPNGYIIADNTLWSGHVVDSAYDNDKQTVSLREFNAFIAKDHRVEKVMLPIRDGLTIIKRLS